MSPAQAAIRLTVIYITFGLIWILFSDRALEMLIEERTVLIWMQTFKGWAYVLLTGLVFGTLTWLALRRQQRLNERDGLTALYNWSTFRHLLHNELELARRSHQEVALTILNLDGFRQYNSRFGQKQGDLILYQMAEKLRSLYPPCALIGRIAADEFCIAMRGDNAQTALLDATYELQHQIRQSGIDQQQDIQHTCRAGIAFFPHDAQQSKDLINAANLALTESKEQGPGALCLYRESYGESVNKKVQLTLDLKQAIGRNELYLLYQPQFCDKGKTLISVEVLLRWLHPVHGTISPDIFIPLAEQQGLINSLTNFVCCRAVYELTQYEVLEHIEHVSVNVSAHDLNDMDAFNRFVERFSAVPAHKVQLEITETAVMANLEHAVELLHALKKHGFQISVDDFGTGYSSLSIISRLPVDELKIDRAFIRDLDSSDSDLLIVRTILAMAHALDLRVVAEGVENQKQMELLSSLQCDLLQGYYLSRPVPAEQLKEMYT